ncbi:right-handed parallel beta-helix repeat-containing protein [Arenibacter sp. S6351L]|uniref:right-handed parallel beta-helix repeat-containing protein n=1 Tax=Arenibacter sp. S6351L TaxID=2926407 RepID=UPI001FF53BE0|nr:right-handed parallel beta-helix repeat-containing protein [Arenibacter sp. S6351L]MCK0133853.1 right-handed parallel beta-helix repeat-containing protein [Arenibacter sp. S6351L]
MRKFQLLNRSPKNYKIVMLLVISLLCGAGFSQSEGLLSENVVFTTEIAEDASPAVLARIRQAKEYPISEIKFEKGTYHFYPDKAFEKFTRISNHDDVLAKTAMPIFGMQGLTINGQGSTFIFHGRMIPFLIEDSKNITITNVTVDWAVPFHSEGLIVANDVNNNSFDMELSEEYPYEIRNGQLIFVKEYYEHNLGQSILFDPARNAIAFNTEVYTPISATRNSSVQHNLDKIKYKYKTDPRSKVEKVRGKEDNLRVEEVKPGTVRIFNHKQKLPPVGMVLVCKGDQSLNRLAPAFRITGTEGFNAKNVNVHHAGGMGLIAENSSDLILDSFNVTPSQGRMVSTTADATHFVGCRGKVELRNCTFNNQLDDATNVHGTYQEVMDVIGKNSIGVRMGHAQQQGFTIGRANDTIGLVRLATSFFPYDYLTLKSTEYINGRYQIISFNEDLPAGLKVGDLIENVEGYPELLVQNCNISRNRARGLLISNPKKTVIENNYFSTEMEAILIPVESSHWFESGNAANLIIRNNTFQDNQHSGFNRGVIRFVTDDENHNIAFKNIEMTNNQFHQFDNLILEISNVDGLLFQGNTITNSGSFPILYPDNPAITVKASKNIVFKKNKYMGKAKQILLKDELLRNLKFK